MYLFDTFNEKKSTYELRDVSLLVLPLVKTSTYGLNSHRYQSAKLWNTLDDNVKCATNMKEFKTLMEKWQHKLCSCTYCHVCVLNYL